MKKVLKKTKGITLVALVITIIVLLILAGVAISQLTDSGLFGKAKTAKQKQENAQILENSLLGDYEDQIDILTGRGDQKPDFSLNEQSTGRKWIDGKTIYSKLIDLGFSFAIKNEDTTFSSGIIPETVDFPISSCFYIVETNNMKAQVPSNVYYLNNAWKYRAINVIDSSSTRHVYLYLEYTKK